MSFKVFRLSIVTNVILSHSEEYFNQKFFGFGPANKPAPEDDMSF